MPVNIKKIDRISVNKRCRAQLYKRNNHRPITFQDDGRHLTTDYKINTVTKLFLSTADKLSPFIQKHPKIGKVLFITFENFAKISEKLSK